jgi:GNAT superfamily N-acetyltransferase
MRIVVEPPSVDDFHGLVPHIRSHALAERIISSGAVFVCAYNDNGGMVGVIWAHGDGRSWLSTVYVTPPAQNRGISRRIRQDLVDELARRTVGDGFLYGFYKDEAFAQTRNRATGYGAVVTDARVMTEFTGVLKIKGSA